MSVERPCILVGVTGCIAAYKAGEIVRGLQKAGVRVKVVMTEHGTHFVDPVTFRALTHEKVAVGLFDDPSDPIRHISLAQECDVFLIAPCTANVMAKVACGIADDLLSTTALATTATLAIAPAANVHMYEAAATQENMATLRRRGVRFIEGDAGYLACGDVGRGRLADPAVIVRETLGLLAERVGLDALREACEQHGEVPFAAVMEQISAVSSRHPERCAESASAPIPTDAPQPAAVADFIHNMGIRSFIDPVPALCLGSSESNVFELVSAFSTFANEGVHTDPIFVTRIEDRQGNVIANFIPQSQDAVSERTAYTMLTMLQDVVNSGTAGRLKWQFGLNDMEIGGKTGTSNKNRDAWFMCVAPKLVAGAWVGGEDQAVHFVAGGEGSVMALPIVGDFMKRVYDDGRLGVSRADQFIRPAMMPRYDCDEEVDPDERPTEPGIAEDDN